MKDKVISTLGVTICCITSGCNNVVSVASKPALYPPLPEIVVTSEASFSGHEVITEQGVEEYISLYGDAGWETGLNDGRTAIPREKMMSNETKHLISGRSLSHTILRVKDVFCFRYLLHENGSLRNEWSPSATLQERDVLIDKVLAEVRRRSSKKS